MFTVTVGHDAQAAYRAGVESALCDEATRSRLRRLGEEYAWPDLDAPGAGATSDDAVVIDERLHPHGDARDASLDG